MFKKTLIILGISLLLFALGHYLGFKTGFATQTEESIKKLNRYQLSSQIAYSFTPLRSTLDNDTDNAVFVLTNTLSASIMGLTDAYDPNDTESASEIMRIMNTITEWQESNNFSYDNASSLKDAINEFNLKHNSNVMEHLESE